MLGTYPYSDSDFVDTRLANVTTHYLIPPKDIRMRIPDHLLGCVVFIGVEKPKGMKFCGTGFFTAVKSSRVPNMSIPYFVTARHVLAKVENTDFFIRVNTKDGKATLFKCPAGMKWWFHPDETQSADVAVFPVLLPDHIYKTLDFRTIPLEMMASSDDVIKEKEIGIGDEVFSIGLFTHHSGNDKNHPIVRMGNISMIPHDQIPTKSFGNMEVYLIESRSIGGLSGSPVFVLKQKHLGEWKIYLLGLIHGHWDIDNDKVIDGANEDSEIKAGVNVGIAMVAPAKKIIETINQKELADNRREIEDRWIEKNSPTPD